MKTKSKKWYIGINKEYKYVAFQSSFEPTFQTHGEAYIYTIGAFRTKRACLWAEKYGKGNPHFAHVDDAERLSKHE